MDDLRISSLGLVDAQRGQTNDGSRKRSRHRQVEPQEELIDQVTISSADEIEEELPGYSPIPSDPEPK